MAVEIDVEWVVVGMDDEILYRAESEKDAEGWAWANCGRPVALPKQATGGFY